jgi:hypothetical protein
VRIPSHSALYEINTRVLLTQLTQKLGRHATLLDIPDRYLDQLASDGFNWLWLLGLWKTGCAARRLSQSSASLQKELEHLVPGFRTKDVFGSCFSIQAYDVHPDFGGNPALERLRARIHARGMRLLLDFVPNHTAPDHEWVRMNPHFYISGTQEQLEREPHNYVQIAPGYILAHGRGPHVAAWTDTLQLNYANPDLQYAMASELERIAGLCDGVRCEMAMLVLPDVFEKTWGHRPPPFWPDAIRRTRARKPEFLFMAEAYWGLESALQDQGFDYTWDKGLYDRLRQGKPRAIREYLRAGADFQRRSVRFLENHNESRAAKIFPEGQHQAAAVLTCLSQGMALFHQGQLDGAARQISLHLNRSPSEPVNMRLRDFYNRLLRCLRNPALSVGEWRLLECEPAWNGNWTSSCYICFAWRTSTRPPLVGTVNFAPHQSQCYVRIPFEDFRGKEIRLRDLMSDVVYLRHGSELIDRGLYLDVPAWAHHVFELTVNRPAGDGDRRR